MKRDMDLVRKLLLLLEESPKALIPDEMQVEGFTEEQVGHHFYLMHDAGLIVGEDMSTRQYHSIQYAAICLRWQGHEFLAAAKDDSTWAKVKAKLKDKIGAVGLAALTNYLQQVAKEAVGL